MSLAKALTFARLYPFFAARRQTPASLGVLAAAVGKTVPAIDKTGTNGYNGDRFFAHVRQEAS
jgi:hypothetical protein